jgi:hypothetical protein
MTMAEDSINLKFLQSRINDIKQEGQESVDFTIEYLQCLMARHDLMESIPDDFELDDVPDSILDTLRKGEIPTKDEIILMDTEIQNYFLFELIWLCGMTAIAYYTSDESDNEQQNNPNTFDVIVSMLEVSPGHATGCYLIAVFTLLMSQLPTEAMISNITNNFSDDFDQCQKNMDYFVELASSILTRHKEDKLYMSGIDLA